MRMCVLTFSFLNYEFRPKTINFGSHNQILKRKRKQRTLLEMYNRYSQTFNTYHTPNLSHKFHIFARACESFVHPYVVHTKLRLIARTLILQLNRIHSEIILYQRHVYACTSLYHINCHSRIPIGLFFSFQRYAQNRPLS